MINVAIFYQTNEKNYSISPPTRGRRAIILLLYHNILGASEHVAVGNPSTIHVVGGACLVATHPVTVIKVALKKKKKITLPSIRSASWFWALTDNDIHTIEWYPVPSPELFEPEDVSEEKLNFPWIWDNRLQLSHPPTGHCYMNNSLPGRFLNSPLFQDESLGHRVLAPADLKCFEILKISSNSEASHSSVRADKRNQVRS